MPDPMQLDETPVWKTIAKWIYLFDLNVNICSVDNEAVRKIDGVRLTLLTKNVKNECLTPIGVW